MKWILFILSFSFFLNVDAKSKDISEYISDENFRSCIMSQYNMEQFEKKEVLEVEDLKQIRNLNCSSYMIANTKGVEKLTNLTTLNLSNNNITTINLEKNLELESLEIKNNLLKKINVSRNINLLNLDLSDNKIKQIFLANNILLKKLDLSNNQLTQLDIKGNLNLSELSIKGNSFSYSIEKRNSFKPSILYNPYFQEKIENVSYTSSDHEVILVDENGKLEPISSGRSVVTKSYFIKNGEQKEEVKEVNYFKLEENEEKGMIVNNNIPYIFSFGMVLLLLGIYMIRKHIRIHYK